MGDTSPKKSARRSKTEDGSSPIPNGPGNSNVALDAACGHSGCGRQCQVRHVGPTTHLRDHDIVHAAKGSTHAWTAALVAGLAVVLTGAIAYTAVEAEAPKRESDRALRELTRRIDTLDKRLQQVLDQCRFEPVEPPVTIEPEPVGACGANCPETGAGSASSTMTRVECLAQCKKDSPAAYDACVKKNCASLTR